MKNQLAVFEDIQLDSSAFTVKRMRLSDDGWLDVWGVCASTADPLDYGPDDPKGERVEEVTLAALQTGLDSLKGAPVTIEHPPVPLTPSNVAEYQVGVCMDASILATPDKVGEFDQHVHLRILKEDAIEQLTGKKMRMISPGYLPVRQVLGEGRYRQLARHNNHIALTQLGRGERAHLFLDSKKKDTHVENENKTENEDAQTPEPQAPLTGDGEQPTGDEMPNFEKMYGDAKMENDKLREQMDALQAQMDAMKMSADMDESAEEMSDDADDMCEDMDDDEMSDDADDKMQGDSANVDEHAIFQARKAALEMATVYKVEKSDVLSTDSLRRAVVQKAQGDAYTPDRSQAYVDAFFDELTAKHDAARQNSASGFVTARSKTRPGTQNDSKFTDKDDVLAGIKVTSIREQREAASRRK